MPRGRKPRGWKGILYPEQGGSPITLFARGTLQQATNEFLEEGHKLGAELDRIFRPRRKKRK